MTNVNLGRIIEELFDVSYAITGVDQDNGIESSYYNFKDSKSVRIIVRERHTSSISQILLVTNHFEHLMYEGTSEEIQRQMKKEKMELKLRNQ